MTESEYPMPQIKARAAEIQKRAIAIANNEDGKNDIANAEAIVHLCEKIDEIATYGQKCDHCGDYVGEEPDVLCGECFEAYGPEPEE